MLPLICDRAELADFRFQGGQTLTGDDLRAVRDVEASILRFGLLAPVVVTRDDGTSAWRVLDGRKRLLAIRRLRFAGRLPRSLATIPYIVADVPSDDHPLSLLGPIEQFDQVVDLRDRGLSVADIACALYAPVSYVEGVLSVERLSDRLRNAWFGGAIELEQARAFATLPRAEAQDALLLALGPFAKAPDILRAIADGETVLRVGTREEDTLILPSRAPSATAPAALPRAA